MGADRAAVLTHEREVGRGPRGLANGTSQFLSPSNEKIADARKELAAHEANQGRVVKLVAPVYPATRAKWRKLVSVDMSFDEKWSRRRAVEVHNETADEFFAEYRGD